MQFSNMKPVLIGIGAAAIVMAITGASLGSGVGALFSLGQTNKVNATSSLVGSARHSMLSVTNKGTGPALSLQVARGKAPFSVSSPAQVADLNASLLGGLAAGQFVQGGGQSRSFGFSMSTSSTAPRPLLSVPGFGTLEANCASNSGLSNDVTIETGPHTMDMLTAILTSAGGVTVNSNELSANSTILLTTLLSISTVPAEWQQMIIRYSTGSGSSLAEHVATINLMVLVNINSTCDFDASAIIGPGTTGP
jgi:hypothetical protein